MGKEDVTKCGEMICEISDALESWFVLFLGELDK